MAGEATNLDVDGQLDSHADASDIMALAPDVVLIATSSVPSDPLGLDLSTVWDALSGHFCPEGDTLIYDSVREHAAISLADRLSAEGVPTIFVTQDRQAGQGLGGQNSPIYLRNLANAGVRIVTDQALVGVSASGNKRIAHLRHAFTRQVGEVAADTIIADFGTEPVAELFDAMSADARNLGEIDPEAMVALALQPEDANPDGDFLLLRMGNALARGHPRLCPHTPVHSGQAARGRLCQAREPDLVRFGPHRTKSCNAKTSNSSNANEVRQSRGGRISPLQKVGSPPAPTPAGAMEAVIVR